MQELQWGHDIAGVLQEICRRLAPVDYVTDVDDNRYDMRVRWVCDGMYDVDEVDVDKLCICRSAYSIDVGDVDDVLDYVCDVNDTA